MAIENRYWGIAVSISMAILSKHVLSAQKINCFFKKEHWSFCFFRIYSKLLNNICILKKYLILKSYFLSHKEVWYVYLTFLPLVLGNILLKFLVSRKLNANRQSQWDHRKCWKCAKYFTKSSRENINTVLFPMLVAQTLSFDF